MNKYKFKYIFWITIFLATFVFYNINAHSKINTKIIYKINDHIITTVDLENEMKFLLFLNLNLKNLSKSKIEDISKDSLINRKIKELELIKFTNLDEKDLGIKFIKNFLLISKYDSLENLRITLQEVELEFDYFEKNFIVDNVWREFIFSRFKSRVNIDINQLKSQLKKQNNEVEELNISEIMFEVISNTSLDIVSKKIYGEIDKSGFEAAASIYSISESKNFGGKVGWIKSNQISEKIYNEIKKGAEITTPIKINNKYLIIKINERRKSKEIKDLDQELKRLINIETEKELNKLGYIYFNKIKKRTFINEI